MIQQSHSWADIQTDSNSERHTQPRAHSSTVPAVRIWKHSDVQWRTNGQSSRGAHAQWSTTAAQETAPPCAATEATPSEPPGHTHFHSHGKPKTGHPQTRLWNRLTDRENRGVSVVTTRKEGGGWTGRLGWAEANRYPRDGQHGPTVQHRERSTQHPTVNRGREQEKEYNAQRSHLLHSRRQNNAVNQLFFSEKKL